MKIGDLVISEYGWIGVLNEYDYDSSKCCPCIDDDLQFRNVGYLTHVRPANQKEKRRFNSIAIKHGWIYTDKLYINKEF